MGLFGFKRKEKTQPAVLPGEEKDAGSEDLLKQAQEEYRKALALRDSYQGDDGDEAEVRRGVAECRLGELNLTSGDPGEALSNFENAAEILEKVTGRNPQEKYRKIYVDILGKLGKVQREEAVMKIRANPLRSVNYLQPLYATVMKLVRTERGLVKEFPTVENRVGLAKALYSQAELEADKTRMRRVAEELLEIITQLQEETGADTAGRGDIGRIEQDIRELLKQRRVRIR